MRIYAYGPAMPNCRDMPFEVRDTAKWRTSHWTATGRQLNETVVIDSIKTSGGSAISVALVHVHQHKSSGLLWGEPT